jgi:type III secretion protein D
MIEHTHPFEPSAPLELRVLAGTLQGSRSVIDAARLVHVGADTASDIVLPEADLEGGSLAFRAVGKGVRVRTLGGTVSAAGASLATGEEIELPLYIPLHLGKAVIALGWPDAPEWTSITLSGGRETAVGTGREAPDKVAADVPSNYLTPSRAAHRWPRWLVMGGGAMTAVSMSVLALAYSVAPPAVSARSQAPQAEAALRAAGFPKLAVQPGNGQDLVVSGYLDTSAQRAQVEQLIKQQPLPSRLSVWVNQDVVAAVLDVFRVNGVAADVAASGPGTVTAVTRVADAGRLEQIKTAARRDVPGLQSLEVRNTPPAPVPEPAPVIDDPGKRVTSIVPGDPAYLVTADGTRYFEGSLLPTGHRVAAIREREVLLERNGTTAPLRF